MRREATMRRNLIQREGSLEDNYPAIAQEWDFGKNKTVTDLTPQTITKGSSMKVWWICPNGHSYLAIISNRTKGEGCKQCYLNSAKRMRSN